MASQVGRGAPSRVPFTAIFVVFLFLFYGAWAALWASASTDTYTALMHVWSVNPVFTEQPSYAKQPLPFFDLAGVLSWSECDRQGFDVFVNNPCDPLNRPLNYSPLLRDLPFERIGARNSIPAGLVADLLFLSVLPFIFRPRSVAELAVAIVASASQAVLFALERANTDAQILTLVAAACFLGTRFRWARMAQYGAAVLGTLVKFYPALLLILALRERPRAFAWVFAVSFLLLGGFAWFYWADIGRALSHLPSVTYTGDMFGAFILPRLLHKSIGLPWVAAYAMMAAAAVLLCWMIVRLVQGLRASPVQPDFSDRSGLLLLCGSVTIFGCYWVESNVAYRAIFLLPVLPRLVAMRRTASGGKLARWLLWAIILTLGCLWADTMRTNLLDLTKWIYGDVPLPERRWPMTVFFLLREARWWYVVGVLGAFLVCFVLQSPVLAEAARRIGIPRAGLQTD
jgi:hypothetical protein